MTAESLVAFLSHPLPWAVFAGTLPVAVPLGSRLSARHGAPRPVGILLLAAVGVIAALTLTPNYAGSPATTPPHYLTTLTDPARTWYALSARPVGEEQYANIALYVPVGVLGALLRRNAWRPALLGLLLTVAVETLQAGIPGRDGSLTDIRNNALGAWLGALAIRPLWFTGTKDSDTARRRILKSARDPSR